MRQLQTHHHQLPLALLCTFAALAIAGCGAATHGAEKAHAALAPPAPVSSVLRLTAGPGPVEFNTARLQAKAGRIEIKLANHSSTSHNVRIQTAKGPCCFHPGYADLGGTQFINPGQSTVAFVTLKPGRYYFLCTFSSHWQAGMHGVLIVR